MCVQLDVRVVEGIYLNISVTVMCFVTSVMLSHLMNVFICT